MTGYARRGYYRCRHSRLRRLWDHLRGHPHPPEHKRGVSALYESFKQDLLANQIDINADNLRIRLIDNTTEEN